MITTALPTLKILLKDATKQETAEWLNIIFIPFNMLQMPKVLSNPTLKSAIAFNKLTWNFTMIWYHDKTTVSKTWEGNGVKCTWNYTENTLENAT